jgi:hypothetical protein
LSKPSKIEDKLAIFSYLNGDVIHYKVISEGHAASSAIREKSLLDFLESDGEKERSK